MATETPKWLSDWSQGDRNAQPWSSRVEGGILGQEIILSTQIALPYFEGDNLTDAYFSLEITPDDEERFMLIDLCILPLNRESAKKLELMEGTLLDEWDEYEKKELLHAGIVSGLGDTDSSENNGITPITQIDAPDEDDDTAEIPGLHLIFEEVDYGKNPADALQAVIDSVRSYNPYFYAFASWFVESRIPELEAHVTSLPPNWSETVLRNKGATILKSGINPEDGDFALTAQLNDPSHSNILISVENPNKITNMLYVVYPVFIPQTDEEHLNIYRAARFPKELNDFDTENNFLKKLMDHDNLTKLGFTPAEIDVISKYSIDPNIYYNDTLEGVSVALFGSMFRSADTSPDESLSQMLTLLPKLAPHIRSFADRFIREQVPALEVERKKNTASKQPGLLGQWIQNEHPGLMNPTSQWLEPKVGLTPYIEYVNGKIIDSNGSILEDYKIQIVDYTDEFSKEKIEISMKLPQYVVQAVEANEQAFIALAKHLGNNPQDLSANLSIGDIEIQTDIGINREVNGNAPSFITLSWTINRQTYESLKKVGWTKQIILEELYPQCMNKFFALQPHIESFASGFKTTS